MEMEDQRTRDYILARIKTFLHTEGVSEREFGLRAVSDHKFVARLRDSDVGVTLTSIEKAEAFMQKHETGKSEAA